MREFTSGATRDDLGEKYDYEGFISPMVLHRYAVYMHEHRKQSDGKLRDSDNWQKGIPVAVYMSSMWRHFMDVWLAHRGYETEVDIIDALCAMMFNVNGMLFQLLNEEGYGSYVLRQSDNEAQRQPEAETRVRGDCGCGESSCSGTWPLGAPFVE